MVSPTHRGWCRATGTASSACSRTCCSTSSSTGLCLGVAVAGGHGVRPHPPALGIALPFRQPNSHAAAWRLAGPRAAKRQNTAMPLRPGIAAHVHVVFLVMLVFLETRTRRWPGTPVSPEASSSASSSSSAPSSGLAIRAMTPRAAMLGDFRGQRSVPFRCARRSRCGDAVDRPGLLPSCSSRGLPTGRCPAACLAGWSR